MILNEVLNIDLSCVQSTITLDDHDNHSDHRSVEITYTLTQNNQTDELFKKKSKKKTIQFEWCSKKILDKYS